MGRKPISRVERASTFREQRVLVSGKSLGPDERPSLKMKTPSMIWPSSSDIERDSRARERRPLEVESLSTPKTLDLFPFPFSDQFSHLALGNSFWTKGLTERVMLKGLKEGKSGHPMGGEGRIWMMDLSSGMR